MKSKVANEPIIISTVPTKPPSCIFPQVLGIEIKLANSEPPWGPVGSTAN